MGRTDKSPLSTFDAHPDHPLFPVEEGEPSPQVGFIQVTRIDRGVQVWGPIFRADELQSTEDIFELFGGGHYDLVARGYSKNPAKPESPGNVTKHRRFVLPGRSKPISKDPTPEELRAVDGSPIGGARAPEAPPAPSSSGGPGMSDQLMIAFLTMQQNAAQQQMQMQMEMQKAARAESQTMMQSMVAMMTAVVGAIAGRPAAPTTGIEDFSKMVKLARDLGAPAKEASSSEEGDGIGGIGRLVENAADAIQGLVQLKQSGPILPPPPEGTNGAPAPGSAAAVADGMLPKA